MNPNYKPTTSEVLPYTSKTVKVFETDELEWDETLWTDANGDTFTFSLVTNATGFVTLDLPNSKIVIAPSSNTQVGTYSVGISVDDGFGGIRIIAIPLTIVANSPPVLVSEFFKLNLRFMTL